MATTADGLIDVARFFITEYADLIDVNYVDVSYLNTPVRRSKPLPASTRLILFDLI
jgi:hypothetical protein